MKKDNEMQHGSMTMHDHQMDMHSMSNEAHDMGQAAMQDKQDTMATMDHHRMQHGGHDHMDMMDHGGQMMHMGNMRLKLIVAVILTIPLLILTPMMGVYLPFTVTDLPGQSWLILLLGSIIFFYSGSPFYQGARGELAARKPAMMTLITMGISVAYVYSVYVTIQEMLHPEQMGMNFFWELASLIIIMLIGHIVEMNAVMRAGSAVDALSDLMPDVAHMQMQDMVHDVPTNTLAVHDRVLVKANERVPLDGMIVEGAAQIDESLLTGEVALVAKKNGDDVVGGSLNGNQPFVMMVMKTADVGYVSQVQQLVAVAQKNKSRVENLADQVASWLFYAATMIGVLALIIWTVLNGVSFALPIAVTVFIIACPHALGLAVPLVVARLTGLAASRGLLIQNRTALEQVDRLRYVVLDKTGTLTEGKFTVQQVVAYNDASESEILAQIAALEAGSVHPIGQSIVAYAQTQQVPVPSAENVASITGVGVQGTINGQSLKIVSGQYLQEHGQSVALLTGSYTVSYLVTQADEVLGAIALGDQIKPQAAAFITALQARQLIPVMLTGDNEQAAQAIATELGITHVEAGLKPEDKATRVQQYQQSGLVMFVGDGVNDSLALATADLGVAIGSGTEVAINAADVVLVNSNPIDILALLDLAHQSNRKMKENLAWGAGYNVIAIPLAAGLLIPFGFTLSPMVGAIIMSLSTVIVALNAMTLRLKENV